MLTKDIPITYRFNGEEIKGGIQLTKKNTPKNNTRYKEKSINVWQVAPTSQPGEPGRQLGH